MGKLTTYIDRPNVRRLHYAVSVAALLSEIQKNHVRDSTTVVSWKVNIDEAAAYASNQ